MSRILVTNGAVITKDALLKNSAVLIEGSKIRDVGKTPGRDRGFSPIGAKGSFVSPGFIDTHIHGRPETIFSNELRSGTTSVVIALSCDRPDRIYDAVEDIKRFVKEDPLGKNILGIRLEGPFINNKKAGAQDKRYIKRPDREGLLDIVEKCGGLLKIMTIAPELKGASALIRLLKRKNIIASIGHSDAAYEDAIRGIDAGVSHATHIFNAMSGVGPPGSPGVNRRSPGASAAALLDERITAEIILDLIHVHPAFFKTLVKVKELSKILLITDSVRAESRQGTKVSGGVYKFADGRIAGSRLTMIDAVKNAVRVGKISLVDAVRMASANAAALLGVQSRKGSIAAGMDADMVIFDKSFDVKMTLIGGKIVYKKKGF